MISNPKPLVRHLLYKGFLVYNTGDGSLCYLLSVVKIQLQKC